MTGAGKLDQRIIIQAETGVEDGGGGSEKGWSAVATVWAAVVPLSGREQVQGGQLAQTAQYRITIRNRAVAATQRLLWRGRVLNIRQAPDPGPAAQFREIIAEEGVAT